MHTHYKTFANAFLILAEVIYNACRKHKGRQPSKHILCLTWADIEDRLRLQRGKSATSLLKNKFMFPCMQPGNSVKLHGLIERSAE